MTLIVSIATEETTDFDDNPTTIKVASATLDGVRLKETFPYTTESHAAITADVRTKLAARGYQFE